VIRVRLALALLVALVLVAGCGTGHKQAHAQTDGTIVVRGSVGGRDGTYAIRPDGSGMARLDLGVSDDDDVFWNPAGTTALVVVFGEGLTDHAFLLNVARGTKRPVRLPHLDGVSLPSEPWSADGRRLLLWQNSDKSRLVAYTVATGKAVRLDVPGYADPRWSGDGRSVIFSDGRSVYTAPARGGQRTRVAKFAHLEPDEPQSSADGKWISFTASQARRIVYDVVRANGTGLHAVPGAVSAAWSPSGERLAFAGFKEAGTLDLASGKRSVVSAPFDSPFGDLPAWSPGGTRVLFERRDLADAPDYEHVQLWTMRANGSGAHPLTHAFPPDAGEWNGPTWVAASLPGRPVPRPQLVALKPTKTLTTDRPVVSLSANGVHAAIAEGFGFFEYPGPIGQPRSGGPLGPIRLWNEATGATTRVVTHGCRHVPTVLLARRIGYVCDNSEYEELKQSLRLGSTTVTRTEGNQGTGTSFRGTTTDGRRVVFGVEDVPLRGRVLSPRLLIEAATASGSRVLWSVAGYGQVLAVDGGGIAYLHGMHQNILTVRSGSSERRIRFARQGVSAAALEGSELVVLESDNRLSVWDPENGKVASWPTAAGDTASFAVGGTGAELAAYSTGVGIHVMRLSDGHEIVLNLGPDATGAALTAFGSEGLFYAYNEAYATRPGHVGFITLNALEHAISANGRQAR
jgi:hypothetical protein